MLHGVVEGTKLFAGDGIGSDTEYESEEDDDERRRESVYVNDAEHWQSVSDHDDIPLPQ